MVDDQDHSDASHVQAILEDAVERIIAGQDVDLEDLAVRHPEHAAGIRLRLPAIRMLLETDILNPVERPVALRPAIPSGYHLRGVMGRGDRGLVLLRREKGPGTLGRFGGLSLPALLRVFPLDGSDLLVERLEGARLSDTIDPDRPPGEHSVSRIAGCLRREKDPYAALAEGFERLREALTALHDRGHVHGHLYPGAIWVVTLRGPVLVEPGGSIAGSELGMLRSALPFRAPEILRNPAIAPGPAADHYGLAATLYAVLTNRPPATGGDAPGILHQMETKWPPDIRRLNPRVPAHLAAAVSAALSPDPELRVFALPTR